MTEMIWKSSKKILFHAMQIPVKYILILQLQKDCICINIKKKQNKTKCIISIKYSRQIKLSENSCDSYQTHNKYRILHTTQNLNIK